MSSGLKGELKVGESAPRVGAKAGGGARRQGGKGGGVRRGKVEPSRLEPRREVALGGRAPAPPRAKTGRANPPARATKPSNPRGDRGVSRGLFDEGQLDSSQRAQYLADVQRATSKRKYQQEVSRVNREIRETGFFKAPSGKILAGLEKSAQTRETRARGGGSARKVSEPEPEPEPIPQPEPEPEPEGVFDEQGFKIPSARFEVDRVGRGSNVDEFEEPLARRRPTARQPQPEPEPFASIGGVAQIQRRLRTGGSAGGLPQQRSAPTPSVSAPIGNTALSRTRTTPAITGFAPASAFAQGGASPRGEGIKLKIPAFNRPNLGAFDRVGD